MFKNSSVSNLHSLSKQLDYTPPHFTEVFIKVPPEEFVKFGFDGVDFRSKLIRYAYENCTGKFFIGSESRLVTCGFENENDAVLFSLVF